MNDHTAANRSLVLFLGLLLSFSAGAQSALLGSPSDNELSNTICADHAGNYFIGGFRNYHAVIVRQNAAHKIVWTRELDFATAPWFKSVIGFIDIVGDTLFGCGTLHNSQDLEAAFCFKLNATTGEPYWLKTMTSPERTYYAAMRYSNGLFMLVGGGEQLGSGAYYDGFVTGISSLTGAMLWQTPYLGILFPGTTVNFIDHFYSASEIVNGKLFITGSANVYGSPLNRRPLLIGVDVNGTVVLNRYLLFDAAVPTPPWNKFVGQVIEFDGPDSLVVAYYGDDTCTISCVDLKVGLLKCDLQGNIGLARYYDLQGIGTTAPYALNVTPEGYVIFGLGNIGVSGQNLFVLKTDKQGHVQDCIRIDSPNGAFILNTGTRLSAGKGAYRNGLHYFAATRGTGINRDICKVILNDALEDVMHCHSPQHLSVSERDLPLFSGSVNIVPDPMATPVFTNGSDTLATIQDSCASASVDLIQDPVCLSPTIRAFTNGLNEPVYSWSNGETTDSATISSADTLILVVTDAENCCIFFDTIIPAFDEGNLQLKLFYLPNTFTPNVDAYNELYTWKGENVWVNEARIFNRWGETVYHETGGFTGWDGLHKGAPCPEGIYQVVVSYTDCSGNESTFIGHVTLLR